MVTRSPSQPAALTQRQVDDLSRGNHEEVARLLHRAVAATPTTIEEHRSASGPVDLGNKEMEAILRSGTAPSRVLQRIAASTPTVSERAKGKAKAAARKSSSAPKLKPPDVQER
jgi:hypothetical protein